MCLDVADAAGEESRSSGKIRAEGMRKALRRRRRTLAVRLLRIRQKWQIRRSVIDMNAKCPACGYRRGAYIEFSTTLRCIIHHCLVCRAAWAEETIVAVQDWTPKA